MRLVTISNEIHFYELDSESELNEYIKEYNGIILEDDVQTKNKFYVFEYLNNSTKIVLGILNEGHGIIPHGILLSNEKVLVISSDKTIYFYNTISKIIVKNKKCDSLIYDIINLEDKGKIIIYCELGIQSLNVNGDRDWIYDCDNIDDFTLNDNYIRLITNETEHKISLLDGKEL
ncbi:hypothetical protein SAMN02745136_00149 [Anaerocolumna jejuensis DSM 15929]|uniref:Uncharacterized protein n=1 Tax=Anaerocolumna jejuensis DSM 15929 TaxID=1121322 RepID=A0A1M6JNV5_9FIRM|nr:hypothetical protein [Anaerocolumna jejuensis]SHJ48328.1 hypothetical protein SAMN02745136_00149 [Anaerocolumna jejuensis DSM 15929]